MQQGLIQDRHERHFPWCEKFLVRTPCSGVAAVLVEVVQNEMQFEIVKTLKTRLKMYGASTSGKKEELVARLAGLMIAPPPDLRVGSWFHFNKKETKEKLAKQILQG